MQKPIARMRLLQTAKTKTAHCDVTFESDRAACMCIHSIWWNGVGYIWIFLVDFCQSEGMNGPKKGKYTWISSARRPLLTNRLSDSFNTLSQRKLCIFFVIYGILFESECWKRTNYILNTIWRIITNRMPYKLSGKKTQTFLDRLYQRVPIINDNNVHQ